MAHLSYELRSIPTNRVIEAYNSQTGWFCTKYDSGKYPLYNWNGKCGVLYPYVEDWREHGQSKTD